MLKRNHSLPDLHLDHDEMKTLSAAHIGLLLFCLCDVILHSVGIHIIRRHISNRTTQLTCILHLSVSELCISVLRVSQHTIHITLASLELDSGAHAYINHYFEVLVYTLFSIVYYFCMLFITLDRLLACRLTVRYPTFCSTKRTKKILGFMWLVGILLAVVIETTHNVSGFDMRSLGIYFYVPFDCVFIVTAAVTYYSMFQSYKKAVRRRTRISIYSSELVPNTRKQSAFEIFYSSKFYVSALLILTFLVFNVVADLIYMCASLSEYENLNIVLMCTRFSYSISFLADGLIYMFCNPAIKKHLLNIPCIWVRPSWTIKASYRRRTNASQGDHEQMLRRVETDVTFINMDESSDALSDILPRTVSTRSRKLGQWK